MMACYPTTAVVSSTAQFRLTPELALAAAVGWRGERESNRRAGGAGAASGPQRAASRAQPTILPPSPLGVS